MAKHVGGAALGYYGWYLVVKPNSPIKDAKELAGKKVGITSAGSGTDILARWTQQDRKVKFTRVPLGGGGLVPNLLSGNIDASVLYSPLSYKVHREERAQPDRLRRRGAAAHDRAWIATDKIIKERPQVVQKTLNALYGGVAFLQDQEPRGRGQADRRDRRDRGADGGGRARRQHREAVDHGAMQKDWMNRALDMARLIGMTDLAPVEEIYTTQFKPVPTMV